MGNPSDVTARRCSAETSIASVTTAETATRVQMTLQDATNVPVGLTLDGYHVQRTAGTGTVEFTLRLYDALTGGKRLAKQSVTLAAAGGDTAGAAGLVDQASATGWDMPLNTATATGLFVTPEAASGSGHTLKIFAILEPIREV